MVRVKAERIRRQKVMIKRPHSKRMKLNRKEAEARIKRLLTLFSEIRI